MFFFSISGVFVMLMCVDVNVSPIAVVCYIHDFSCDQSLHDKDD